MTRVHFLDFVTNKPFKDWRDTIQLAVVPDKDDVIRLDDKSYKVVRRQHKLEHVTPLDVSHTVILHLAPYEYFIDEEDR